MSPRPDQTIFVPASGTKDRLEWESKVLTAALKQSQELGDTGGMQLAHSHLFALKHSVNPSGAESGESKLLEPGKDDVERTEGRADRKKSRSMSRSGRRRARKRTMPNIVWSDDDAENGDSEVPVEASHSYGEIQPLDPATLSMGRLAAPSTAAEPDTGATSEPNASGNMGRASGQYGAHPSGLPGQETPAPVSEPAAPSIDAYGILGIEQVASFEEIHKCFFMKARRLLIEIKGMRRKDKKPHLAKLQEMWIAHDILMDKVTRTDYDFRLMGLRGDSDVVVHSAPEDVQQERESARTPLRIGELLQCAGLLEPQELELAADAHKAEPQMLFGEFLVKQGFIIEEDLQQVLMGQRLIRKGSLSVKNFQLAIKQWKEEREPIEKSAVANNHISQKEMDRLVAGGMTSTHSRVPASEVVINEEAAAKSNLRAGNAVPAWKDQLDWSEPSETEAEAAQPAVEEEPEGTFHPSQMFGDDIEEDSEPSIEIEGVTGPVDGGETGKRSLRTLVGGIGGSKGPRGAASGMAATGPLPAVPPHVGRLYPAGGPPPPDEVDTSPPPAPAAESVPPGEQTPVVEQPSSRGGGLSYIDFGGSEESASDVGPVEAPAPNPDASSASLDPASSFDSPEPSHSETVPAVDSLTDSTPLLPASASSGTFEALSSRLEDSQESGSWSQPEPSFGLEALEPTVSRDEENEEDDEDSVTREEISMFFQEETEEYDDEDDVVVDGLDLRSLPPVLDTPPDELLQSTSAEPVSTYPERSERVEVDNVKAESELEAALAFTVGDRYDPEESVEVSAVEPPEDDSAVEAMADGPDSDEHGVPEAKVELVPDISGEYAMDAESRANAPEPEEESDSESVAEAPDSVDDDSNSESQEADDSSSNEEPTQGFDETEPADEPDQEQDEVLEHKSEPTSDVESEARLDSSEGSPDSFSDSSSDNEEVAGEFHEEVVPEPVSESTEDSSGGDEEPSAREGEEEPVENIGLDSEQEQDSADPESRDAPDESSEDVEASETITEETSDETEATDVEDEAELLEADSTAGEADATEQGEFHQEEDEDSSAVEDSSSLSEPSIVASEDSDIDEFADETVEALPSKESVEVTLESGEDLEPKRKSGKKKRKKKGQKGKFADESHDDLAPLQEDQGRESKSADSLPAEEENLNPDLEESYEEPAASAEGEFSAAAPSNAEYYQHSAAYAEESGVYPQGNYQDEQGNYYQTGGEQGQYYAGQEYEGQPEYYGSQDAYAQGQQGEYYQGQDYAEGDTSQYGQPNQQGQQYYGPARYDEQQAYYQGQEGYAEGDQAYYQGQQGQEGYAEGDQAYYQGQEGYEGYPEGEQGYYQGQEGYAQGDQGYYQGQQGAAGYAEGDQAYYQGQEGYAEGEQAYYQGQQGEGEYAEGEQAYYQGQQGQGEYAEGDQQYYQDQHGYANEGYEQGAYNQQYSQQGYEQEQYSNEAYGQGYDEHSYAQEGYDQQGYDQYAYQEGEYQAQAEGAIADENSSDEEQVKDDSGKSSGGGKQQPNRVRSDKREK